MRAGWGRGFRRGIGKHVMRLAIAANCCMHVMASQQSGMPSGKKKTTKYLYTCHASATSPEFVAVAVTFLVQLCALFATPPHAQLDIEGWIRRKIIEP